MKIPELTPDDFPDSCETFTWSISSTRMAAELNLNILWQYQEEVDRTLREKLSKAQQEIFKIEHEEYFEWKYDDWILKAQNWDQFLYRSIVIITHSIVEKYLNEYCETICHFKKSGVLLTDLKGSGFERAKTYLYKIAQMEISQHDDNWRNLQMLSNIRNCIVHNDAFIKESDNRLPAEILNFKGLSVSDIREIGLSAEYCADIITSAGLFNKKVAELCLKVTAIQK